MAFRTKLIYMLVILKRFTRFYPIKHKHTLILVFTRNHKAYTARNVLRFNSSYYRSPFEDNWINAGWDRKHGGEIVI